MMDWFKQGLAKLLATFLQIWAPQIVAELLAKIDPKQLAAKIKPHLLAVMERMPREWQKNFAVALRIVAETVAASIPEPPK